MGLFAGAVKRLKNSWSDIGKKVGNVLTLAGKSGIPGLFAPLGLGSVVNTSLEKLGQSTYKTGQVIGDEITDDEYLDSLAEINKYGAIFGPYNAYNSIKEHGLKDGIEEIIRDNINYGKEFLPLGGNPKSYITEKTNIVKDIAEEPYNAMVNNVTNTYNEIKNQGVVNYTKNKIDESINNAANTVQQIINDGLSSTVYQKASEKVNKFIGNQNQYKNDANKVMSRITDYINNINK